MDEPTAALGIAEQREVLDLVRTLKDQGVGLIVGAETVAGQGGKTDGDDATERA